MIRKMLAVAVLAASPAMVLAGKSAVPPVGSGSGSVIPSEALSEAVIGADVDGRSLYRQLRSRPDTILLADGRLISPDILMPNGAVITVTVAQNGEITEVKVREPDSTSGSGGGSCSA